MVALSGSVGLGGTNAADDVRTVQEHLNTWLAKTTHASPALATGGVFNPETSSAIVAFQKLAAGLKSPDGRIDPNGKTWRLLSVWGSDASERLSGTDWWHANQARFPNSQEVNDLAPEFSAKVKPFLAALEQAGATVSISSTLRSAQRAYLMHYSWKVAKQIVPPFAVPPQAGVDILWDHGNLVASVKGAKAMVALFGVVFQPSLNSRHIQGRAIDLNIRWSEALSIRDKTGKTVIIGAPNNGALNAALHKVGASYGVIKNVADRPHWSDNGH